LPPPDARHGRHCYRVFDALVHHVKIPASTLARCHLSMNLRLYLFNTALF
jgi:hypothetical protein